MEVLIHFLFEIVKIVILSVVYSLVLFIVIKMFSKKQTKDFKLWLKMNLLIYILLFIFMFTHWGNHGFGDSARIPLKKGLALENIDWVPVASIEDIQTENQSPLETTEFLIVSDKLLGNLQSNFYDYSNQYFILDLKSEELIEFENETKFDVYLYKNKLPDRSSLLGFEKNYNQYWSGWRFWLLP
ncbi:hypothetical protein MP478_12110 [Chryseobacterium sp. WG14]|uniref:hypothetical protein n=1 Tax=Chryseobacterium sp. WG14 TaxID=2926909 RepID=UPI00211E92FC|nr:hypothetical protein [Chryseobacterium sp. WG14]MCQ9640123.1 hypothetical protein [Chryseobacterium sp. WG14]